jgi:flagellar biogenesis protein FliO
MLHLALLLSTTPDAARTAGDGPDLTRYLLVCGGLVLLIAFLGWGFRRVVGRAWGTRAAQRSLQVMDVLPLGGKQKLVVVRCYDRTFALGVGDKEVSLVSELDAVIAPAREPLPAAAERKGFADALARLQGAEPARRLSPGGVLG